MSSQLQAIRDAFDLAQELVEQSVAVEGEATIRFQRVLDEQQAAEQRVVDEAAETPKAA